MDTERGYLQIDLAIITKAVSTNLLRSMDASSFRLLLNNGQSVNGPNFQLPALENSNPQQNMVGGRMQIYRDYDDIQRYIIILFA